MKTDILNLNAEQAGSIELSDEVFGLEPRADILQRVVHWQLARRQAGTHKTKGRSEVSYSTKKIYRQKGTGGARHGDRNVAQFRHGGTAKGPVVRSHAHDLPKKVRALGLKHALSAKVRENALIVLEDAKLDAPKTKGLVEKLGKLGVEKVLIIDGPEVDENIKRASQNLPGVQVMASVGANVYDILRLEKLVLTKAAVEALEARLK